MSLRDFKTIKNRRKFIEKKKGKNLKAISVYPKDLEKAQRTNCENMIGAVSVPLGVAGPILLKGKHAKGDYFLPLVTTEGALVASVSRGCKAIKLSGGAEVFYKYVGITRAPVFQVDGIRTAEKFISWVEHNIERIAKICQSTSNHLKLLSIKPFTSGRNVFLRFSFDTQDAMGMNMATIATHKAVTELIEKETGVDCVSLSSNLCVDKKPSFLNMILGRGRKVWAECVLTHEAVAGVLKTTPEKIIDVNIRKNHYGSYLSGSIGANAHFANVIAALFIATGQDVAHTVEGSIGQTTTELVNGSLYVSIHIPDLPIGTVGGGTGLPAQKESLSILGVSGGKAGNNASKFCEIVAGAVLAGEVSLLASLSEGSLAKAHEKLGRSK